MNIKALTEKDVVESRAENLTISAGCDSVGIASFILRAYHGRTDLAQAVLTINERSFYTQIERVRTLINLNSIDDAHILLIELQPGTPAEKSEYHLEMARIYLFSKQYQEVLDESQRALDIAETTLWTKITLLQIRGHALLKLKNPLQAQAELELGLSLAKAGRDLSLGIGLLRFLVQAELALQKPERAKGYIEQSHKILGEIASEPVWLTRLITHLRGEADYFQYLGDLGSYHDRLQESLIIAQFLDRRVTEQTLRGHLDQLKFSPKATIAPVYHFTGWAYLPRLMVILDISRRAITKLENHPVSRRLIETLAPGPLDKVALFERVWGLPYRPETHDLHLRNALSKLRKYLTKNSLKVQDGQIYLY